MKKLSMFFLILFMLAGAAWGANPCGLCFRFDDNKSCDQWRRLAEVFEKHGLHFSLAVNSGTAVKDSERTKLLKELSERGHEIMDHTPFHTSMRLTVTDPEKYAKGDYIDHIDKNQIYFKIRFNPSHQQNRKMTLSFDGNRILTERSEDLKWLSAGKFLVFPDGSIYGVGRKENDPILVNKYGENKIDLNLMASMKDVPVILADRMAFEVADDGLALLAETSRINHKKMGLPPPRTFIIPGGWGVYPNAEQIQRVYGDRFGYAAGDGFYNRPGVLEGKRIDRFRMTPFWESLERHDVKEEIDILEKQLESGRVIPIISHLWCTNIPGGFDELLKRHDQLLDWVVEKKIPVKTYAEWADLIQTEK